MMEYVIYALLAIIVIFVFYLMWRNDKVYQFRAFIINSLYDSILRYSKSFNTEEWLDHRDEIQDMRYVAHRLIHKHSYASMVYSFKPLKLKYWYSEEDIELIKRILEK